MKTMRGPNLVTTALAVLVVSSACRMFETGETALYVKVIRIKGSARYCSGNVTNWHALTVGNVLKAGATIQTAKDSLVDLTWSADPIPLKMSSGLQNGNLRRIPYRAIQLDPVRLWGDTILGIDELTTRRPRGSKERLKEIRLDLRSGKVLGRVGKQVCELVFEVRFPGGITRVREGLFAVSADGIVSVRSGAVTVSLLNPNEIVEVTEGFQFDTRTRARSRLPVETYHHYQYEEPIFVPEPPEPWQPWPKRPF
jgi:uncharacterized protein YaiE (UPF0345 family)